MHRKKIRPTSKCKMSFVFLVLLLVLMDTHAHAQSVLQINVSAHLVHDHLWDEAMSKRRVYDLWWRIASWNKSFNYMLFYVSLHRGHVRCISTFFFFRHFHRRFDSHGNNEARKMSIVDDLMAKRWSFCPYLNLILNCECVGRSHVARFLSEMAFTRLDDFVSRIILSTDYINRTRTFEWLLNFINISIDIITRKINLWLHYVGAVVILIDFRSILCLMLGSHQIIIGNRKIKQLNRNIHVFCIDCRPFFIIAASNSSQIQNRIKVKMVI